MGLIDEMRKRVLMDSAPKPPPTQALGTGMAAQAAKTLMGRKAQIDAASNYADGGVVKNYAGGGMVRGPGTGTSDSVHAMVRPGSYVMPADTTKALSKMVRLSNGEQVLTPEQTQRIGVKNLDMMKAATHKPSGKSLIAAYRDGGLVDEEERRRRTAFPNQVPAASPYRGMSSPSVPGGFMPGSRAVFNESGKEIRNLVDQGRLGAAAGEAGRAALAYVPAVADDILGAPIRSVGPGLMEAGKQFLGMGSNAMAAPAPATPAPSLVAQARQQATPAPATPAGPEVARPPASVDPQTPSTAPTQQPNEVRPGIFRQGNSFSDTAEGAAEFDRPNVISPQNMAAADALSQRSAARNPIVRMAQEQAGGMRADGGNITPFEESTGGFGILDNGYQDRRAAMMAAGRMAPGARTALTALLRRQEQAPELALRREGMEMEQQGRAEDRGFRREELGARMGDAAASRDLRAQELGDTMQTNAARREAAGVETSAAKRIQTLQDEYLNAKTPEEQQTALRKLQALSGKADSNRENFMTVGGGQEWDERAGAMRNVPQRLIDLRTGQPVGGGQQQAAPALPPGMTRQVGTSGGKPVYEDAQGKRFVAP